MTLIHSAVGIKDGVFALRAREATRNENMENDETNIRITPPGNVGERRTTCCVVGRTENYVNETHPKSIHSDRTNFPTEQISFDITPSDIFLYRMGKDRTNTKRTIFHSESFGLAYNLPYSLFFLALILHH
jgi:hypothetical protein